jgi:ferrous iron transport protein B
MTTSRIALIGNPNCGKTTIFNGLTGSHQSVGNWPGVTVERKTGILHNHHHKIMVDDLPGTYSLTTSSETAMDERIACDYLFSNQADLIINIVDACHLERHLYLTTQLLELGLPLLVVVNMMDVATSRGIQINLKTLQSSLGCSVVAIQATQKTDLAELKEAIHRRLHMPPRRTHFTANYPAAITVALEALQPELAKELPVSLKPQTHSFAVRLLEQDALAQSLISPGLQTTVQQHLKTIAHLLQEDADIMIADARYRVIDKIVKHTVKHQHADKPHWSQTLDKFALHRLLGIPIFLLVMYSLFLFSVNLAGVFQDFFDLSSRALFVDGPTHWLQQVGAPAWLTLVLAQGIGRGINTVLTFIPVIAALFFAMALLERSGYMARATFVVDRLMRALGLPGRAFVPMIVGLGCNVPAIMGARTLENHNDRLLTVLMTPFMSCGARLTIYAVFVSVFFPTNGALVVLSLYSIGIVLAIITGMILRHNLHPHGPSSNLMELPPYHWPQLASLFKQTWQRVRVFLVKAGYFIIPICVLLGVLNNWSWEHGLIQETEAHSLLSDLGRSITPLFHPIGISNENWPATVGLLTGTLAKEVVIGTLNSLYSPTSELLKSTADFNLGTQLLTALHTIPDNLMGISHSLTNPILGTMKTADMSGGSLQRMSSQFDGAAGAYAYLLFILLYIPCISTIAAIAREINWRWAMFSLLWNTGLAYGVAVIFYQAARLSEHPLLSVVEISLVVITFVTTLLTMQQRRVC